MLYKVNNIPLQLILKVVISEDSHLMALHTRFTYII
jgi:hypothetical protein